MSPHVGTQVTELEVLQLMMKENYLLHVGVNRTSSGFPSYMHHYIMRYNPETEECMKFHYTGGLVIFSSGSTAGKVEMESLSSADVQSDIKSGLFIFKGEGYPKSPSEWTQAAIRLFERIGERAYHITYNNCEHFVRYIMTGRSKSCQIEQAGPGKMMVADAADSIINDGKSSTCSAILKEWFLAILNYFKEFCPKLPVKEITKLVKSIIDYGFNILLRSCKNVAKLIVQIINYLRSNSCQSALEICEESCEMNNSVSLSDIKSSLKGCESFVSFCLLTAIITCVIEGADAYCQIQNLMKLQSKGKICDEAFFREKCKIISGVPGSVIGTIIGAIAGQALLPTPIVVGIGGFVGTIVGKCIFKTAMGFIHDVVVRVS